MRNLVFFALLFTIGYPSFVSAEMPKRIVSLKPNITDIVYALGMGERLVGVTKFCDILPHMPRPSVVADYTQPYLEKIIALMPDVVLASEENSSRQSIEAIRGLGIRVELLPFSDVKETVESIKKIGGILGVPQKGIELADKMIADFDRLKNKWGGFAEKSVWIVWGVRPIVVAGKRTYMNELLDIVGLRNAAKDSKIKYPRVGIEEMIASDASMIVDLAMGNEAKNVSRPWDGITEIKAVRNNCVIAMDAGRFRAGPLLPTALDDLAERVHGKDTFNIQKMADR